MRKTINISVSEEIFEFIQQQVDERFYYSVSDYIRSLVSHDQAERTFSSKRLNKLPPLRTANECLRGVPASGDHDQFDTAGENLVL